MTALLWSEEAIVCFVFLMGTMETAITAIGRLAMRWIHLPFQDGIISLQLQGGVVPISTSMENLWEMPTAGSKAL